MAISSPAVIEPNPASDILPAVKRQRHSVAKKRQIVEETLVPGASVARVARAHGVNANQVFQWRRQYRQGRLGTPSANVARLLPVRVAELATNQGVRSEVELRPAAGASPETGEHEASGSASGAIHLEMRKVRLRIEGQIDPAVLRLVLKAVLG